MSTTTTRRSPKATAKVPAPRYTLYIVHHGGNSYRPVLMANNGKPILNETVTRPGKLEVSLARLGDAFRKGQVATVRITLGDFRKRFPAFATNAGKRKARSTKR